MNVQNRNCINNKIYVNEKMNNNYHNKITNFLRSNDFLPIINYKNVNILMK